MLLAGGSEQPFDFFAKSPGRDLDGIHYAMDFLPQQNRRVAGETPPAITDAKEILAKGKHVIVIGGGDTGSDCIGTSFRQGAKIGDAARDHADAAREGEQSAVVAELAAEAARLHQPGRRRQGRILGFDDGLLG